ncbi:23S rRNA (uracil(1939)-C(5))-methyltransferase RlmD [Cyanobium sp. CH-040]|uniref:23S rRNA (uracil(1939)-C(5))-methyltransferase RlmD n=1 Tax=Cyanobium sp. CH-040 TaxID=2823708 RepID=UPI0020CE9BD3|nr:23S rRNA (uracil(1939)-C(5))-methyltransferase RlmD [Cyanobium sp. CH-040]
MDPLLPGGQLENRVSGLSHDGQGVVRHDGQVLFVPGALPGERVRLRLLRRTRSHWTATCTAVLEPSPQRRRPPCILAERCGGCSVQHLEEAAQRSWKRQKVIDALQRIGRLGNDCEQLVAPTLGAGDGLGYRNRAVLPLERGSDGALKAGYYRPGSHRIVNLNHCPVLDPRLDALIAPLKGDLERSGWPVDRHLQAGGGLRHLGLRLGVRSGELLVTLISSHAQLPGLEALAGRWLERWPQLVGVCLNIQPDPTNTLLGPTTLELAGRGWVLEHFAGLTFEVGADTFFQVNTAQAEQVVPLLQTALRDDPPGVLIDAYCGIGTYGLPLAAAGWQVLGIERGAAAVALARRNADRNGLGDRCRFEEGPVAELLATAIGRCRALFVDPPRKGLEPTALAAIRAQPPATLLYLSCDPATLARDLTQLAGAEGPYRLESVQPIDFFPQTSHVECLAVLRLSAAGHPAAAPGPGR